LQQTSIFTNPLGRALQACGSQQRVMRVVPLGALRRT
jgi:hypothetical protein